MFPFPYYTDYEVGDLVIIQMPVEWDSIVAREGEIAIVIEVYREDDESNFFDLNLQLADGFEIPVWHSEVVLLSGKQ